MLAVRNILSSRLISSSDNVESVVVEIDCGMPLIVCVLYIPPAASDLYYQHLSNELSALPFNSDLMVLGDFNFPDIDWDLLCGESRHSTDFCELILDRN